MKSKVKAFLDMYELKMPSNSVPFELKQRLAFSQTSSDRAAQKRRPWTIMLNTYIVAATTLIAGFTFWQLGEDTLFVWTLPPVNETEVIPPDMVTYLEANSDTYLDWSIFSEEYNDIMNVKFYVGISGERFYLFSYIEPINALYVRISSDAGQFMISGSFNEVHVEKTLIETRSNINVNIYAFAGETEVTDEFVFRIPKYLELFNV